MDFNVKKAQNVYNVPLDEVEDRIDRSKNVKFIDNDKLKFRGKKSNELNPQDSELFAHENEQTPEQRVFFKRSRIKLNLVKFIFEFYFLKLILIFLKNMFSHLSASASICNPIFRCDFTWIFCSIHK
jgi:hypothetical protein